MNLETPLPLLIAAEAERSASKVFIEEVTGPQHSYGDFHTRATAWAAAFSGAGVGPDTLVATMLPNSITSYECWIGLAWLRAIEVPINPQFLGQTLVYPLNDSAAETLVIAAALLPRLRSVAGSLHCLKTVVVPDASGELPRDLPWRVVSGEQFLAEGTPGHLGVPTFDQPHAVIYTSGTTGPSKGVLQPWVNLHGMAHGMFPDDDYGDHPDGAVFTCWPTFHSSGKFGMCVAPMLDLRMVFRETFSVTSFWSDIRTHRVTHAPLLVVSRMLMDEPPRSDDADNPLRKVGLYPLIPDYREFEDRFGVRASAGYGNTEVGWCVTTSSPANHRTNGQVTPGYQIRIADEQGVQRPRGETGEILVRHDLPWRLNKGYLGMPEATAEAWADGWFHTGDAGRFDDDGNFYFVDRLKDSLRRRGHNVSSFEVEAEVLAHPEVAECACVGVPSELAREGESVKDDDVKVFVVLSAGSTLEQSALSDWLQERAPKFMLPRYIEVIDHLPRTPTGKVKKAELRAAAAGPGCWDRGSDRAPRSAAATS